MTTQYMLVGTPSSGSDWFAACLQAANPSLTSDPTTKEYFNPICNPRRYSALKRAFGCELVETCPHIGDTMRPANAMFAQKSLAEAENTYAATWMLDRWTFTKEVWSCFRVPFFSARFAMIGLARSAEYTFPPKRLRVLSWYNAIWQSLVTQYRRHAWHFDPMIATMVDRAYMEVSRSLLHVAVAAHAIATAVMRRDLHAVNVATLDWKNLMLYHGSDLVEYIAASIPPELKPDRVAREVEQTRLAFQNDLDRRANEFRMTGTGKLRFTLEAIADGYGA